MVLEVSKYSWEELRRWRWSSTGAHPWRARRRKSRRLSSMVVKGSLQPAMAADGSSLPVVVNGISPAEAVAGAEGDLDVGRQCRQEATRGRRGNRGSPAWNGGRGRQTHASDSGGQRTAADEEEGRDGVEKQCPCFVTGGESSISIDFRGVVLGTGGWSPFQFHFQFQMVSIQIAKAPKQHIFKGKFLLYHGQTLQCTICYQQTHYSLYAIHKQK